MRLSAIAVFFILVKVGYGLVIIPTSPPYNISKHMVHELKHCLAMADFRNLKKCCLGGLRVIKALFDDKPIPKITPLTPQYSYETECMYGDVCDLVNMYFSTCNKHCFLKDTGACIKAGRFEIELLIDAVIRTFSASSIVIPPAQLNQVYGFVFAHPIPNQPPYFLGVSMISDLKHCLKKSHVDKFEECCTGISQILQSLHQNQYFHHGSLTSNCNVNCVAEAVRYHCTPAAEYTFIAIVQGLVETQTSTNLMLIPDKPPYNIAARYMSPLRTCVDKVPTARFQICCHGIATVFYAFVKDESWPTDRITADNCNVFCVEGLVKKFCNANDVGTFRELTHSVLEHYFIKPKANASILTPPLSSQDLWNAARLVHPDTGTFVNRSGGQPGRPMNPLLQNLMESNVALHPSQNAVPTSESGEAPEAGSLPGGKGPKLLGLNAYEQRHSIEGQNLMSLGGQYGMPQLPGHAGQPGFPGAYPQAPGAPPGMQPINQGPPYNFQAPVDHYVKKCYNSSLSALFDKCCRGLSGVLDALMTDQPMPTSDITPDICNVYCVGDTASSHCVPEAKAAFMEISYAILTHYWEGKVFMLPDKPPYLLPESVMTYLRACQYRVPHGQFDKCCHGITNVYNAIVRNETLPTGQFAPHSCDIFCVGHAVKKYCSEDAEEAFLKLTYSAMIHYSKVMFQVCLEPDPKRR